MRISSRQAAGAWSDSTADRAFVLHGADLDPIPSIPYGPKSIPGAIFDCKQSYPWAPSGAAPKPK